MDKAQRKLLRSPSFKRKSKVSPVGQKLTLERVLGLTVSSNAAFSCDPVSGTIAYPAGCVVVLFNPRRNRQSHIFNVSKKTITALAFSGDGKHLVTGECGHQPAVRLWDVEEKTQVAEFHGHKFGINCVAFSPNLKYIVSIGSQHDMMVNVWNWRTGNKVASNKVSCKVSAVSFGADSSSFVTVGNRHVKFWYLDSSRSKINQTVPLSGRSGILGDQKNNFFCDVVCGRGALANSTFAITQSGLLCEFNEKRLLDKWVELRTKSASCIAAGEEHIFIGCAEGVVRVFSSDSLCFIATLPHPHYLGVDVAAATSSSDMICTKTDAKYPDVIAVTVDDDHKKVACVYNDHSLYVWDVVNVKRVGKAWSFLFHSGCIWALEVYPALDNKQTGSLPLGSFLTASSDDTIRIWNLDPQMTETSTCRRNIYSSELLKIVYTEPSHNFLCDVNYNPAGATDKTDTNWDGKNGVRSIRVSPDGEHLASGDRQGNIRIYDLRSMAEIRSIEAHESDVVCLEYSFSRAGPKILASGSRDRLIHVFDVEQRYGLLQTLDDHSAAIQSVRFTDANNRLRMLSCGSDKSLLFRNASLTPGFEFSLDQHLVSKATMYDMVIDPTQKYLATACQDRNLRVYNMATAKQRRNYRASAGDEGTLLRVQLDPSGTYAATSCTDKNLCVLEFYTGELLATAFGHSEISTGLRFTNDLKHLISVSADGCIFVWRLTSDMTKTMRSRMEELGKMPQEEVDMSDLRREVAMMPNPVSLDATFTGASLPALFPVRKENVSPSRGFLPSVDSEPTSSTSYPSTPTGKRPESATSLAQPSPAEYRFSVGPLPNWAKVRFGVGVEGGDGEPDTVQPKGRWAQRFDQNLAFKSQLDLSQLDDETDSRRFTAAFESGGLHGSGLHGGGLHGSGLHGGDLAASMPDLRRETVVLSQHIPAAKNIPIIDDDDEINVDDEEDFFPAFMKDKLLKGPGTESDRSSSDPPDDGRRQRKSNSSSRLSDELGGRRYGNRVSFGSENDRTAGSLDLEDTDDIDSWSDTTEIIYPPSEPESVDPLACTFQVFAADGSAVRVKQKVASVNNDEDSESTDLVSLEEDDDQNEETLVTSTPSTPSDQEKEFTCPRTPDKELFLKENFESVTFTPVAMEKFVQQVATLERAAEANDSSSVPFSPRLSLSSKFLSRSHFGPIRGAVGFGGFQQRAGDNWLDMSWKAGVVATPGSPDKEDPPSPPTRLDNKQPSFSTHKSSSQVNSAGIKEASPPPTIPSSGAPTSPTTTMANSSRSAGVAAVLGAKDRRRTSNGQVKGASGTVVASASQPLVPRQVPSYFKTTKASRMKSSSTNNLHKAVDAGRATGNGGASAASSGGKMEGPAKKRTVSTKEGLSSLSKFSTYASTPNLASFQEDEEEEAARSSPKKTSPASNLRSLQELSISVPDVNLIDDQPSTDSSSSSSGPTHKEKKGGRLSSPTRRALPGGSLGVGKELKLSLAPKGRGELTDNQLMPPPGAPPVSRAAHTTVIRRPITVHKRPTVEMTLEQAKSILTGNSGILGSRQSPSPDDDSSSASFSSSSSLSHSVSSGGQKPGMARRPTDSATPESSQRTLSSSALHAASSRTASTSRNSSSSSAVFEHVEPVGYVPASTLAVAEEIDRTANQLRKERERIAAAALDASRYDPPERDHSSANKFPSSSQLSSSVQLSSNNSSIDDQPPVASFSASSVVSVGAEKEMSVRERIAMLNQNTPKRGSIETSHTSSRSHSPSPAPTAHSSVPQVAVTAADLPPSNEQHVSPRSQSDTGLGSDTDTDSELRHLNDLPRQAVPSGEANSRGNRSRLSLQLQDSVSRSASPSSAAGPEALQTCRRVVGELTTAVQKAKDFHAQIKSSGSNGSTAAVQQQMMTMMLEAFNDAHLALAHLVLQSRAAGGEDGSHSSLSCPLVAEGARDGALQDKTWDMIQPFMSHLSQELAQELAKVIVDRVKDKSSPS